jgi:hypothetical protein
MKGLGWKLIVLIVLAAIVFLWLIKTPIMASYLTNKMRVPVSIGRISMWPSQTKIHNFRIKNPRGFKTSYAFTAQSTEIDYQFKQLIGNPSVIDLIHVDDIYLGVECANPACTANNWTAIGANMPKREGGQEVIIRKLVLTNLTAEIRGTKLGNGRLTRHVDRLEFDDIDSKEGFPTEQLIKEIFGGAGLEQYLKEMFSPQKIFETIRPFIFGAVEEKGAEGPLRD